jgi:hypothetical protein
VIRTNSPRQFERPAYLILLLLGVLTALTTVYGVIRHFSPVPLADQWDGNIGFYIRAAQHPLAAFFEQHNEHRLIFSRIFFFADMRYFGGRNVLLLTVNLLLAGGLALTFFRIVRHCAALTRAQSAGLAGLTLVFAFSWMQGGNFIWGFQSQWFAVYLFALCSFHCIDRCGEAAARADNAGANRWLASGLTAAVLSACSMSSGVLVFPVLFVHALYRRLGFVRIGVIFAMAIFTFFAYFVSWHEPASSGGSPLVALREHPIGVLRYLILYLGSPAGQTSLGSKGADLAGLIVLATLVYQCLRLLINRAATPKATSLLAMAVFIAGNAFATGCARFSFGLDSALASRYTTASLACWLAVGLFMQLNASTPAQRRLTLLVSAVGILIVVSFQRMALRLDADATYALDVAGLALRSHVYDPEFTKGTYPFPAAIEVTAKAAEPLGLSIFAKDQTDYFVPPAHVSSSSACEGKFESVVPTQTPGVYVAKGWIYDQSSRTVPRTIVVTDQNGAVTGTGIAGGERSDIRARFGHRAGDSQWTAFFTARGSQQVSVRGRLTDGTFCALADSSRVVPASP